MLTPWDLLDERYLPLDERYRIESPTPIPLPLEDLLPGPSVEIPVPTPELIYPVPILTPFTFVPVTALQPPISPSELGGDLLDLMGMLLAPIVDLGPSLALSDAELELLGLLPAPYSECGCEGKCGGQCTGECAGCECQSCGQTAGEAVAQLRDTSGSAASRSTGSPWGRNYDCFQSGCHTVCNEVGVAPANRCLRTCTGGDWRRLGCNAEILSGCLTCWWDGPGPDPTSDPIFPAILGAADLERFLELKFAGHTFEGEPIVNVLTESLILNMFDFFDITSIPKDVIQDLPISTLDFLLDLHRDIGPAITNLVSRAQVTAATARELVEDLYEKAGVHPDQISQKSISEINSILVQHNIRPLLFPKVGSDEWDDPISIEIELALLEQLGLVGLDVTQLLAIKDVYSYTATYQTAQAATDVATAATCQASSSQLMRISSESFAVSFTTNFWRQIRAAELAWVALLAVYGRADAIPQQSVADIWHDTEDLLNAIERALRIGRANLNACTANSTPFSLAMAVQQLQTLRTRVEMNVNALINHWVTLYGNVPRPNRSPKQAPLIDETPILLGLTLGGLPIFAELNRNLLIFPDGYTVG